MLIALLALTTAASCQALFVPKSKGKLKSPLGHAKMAADCCVLDVFFVNVPFGDARVNEELWQEIDEQRIDPDLRQRLGQNGFRVGMVDGQIPIVLSQLMKLNDKNVATEQVVCDDLAKTADPSSVSQKHIQARTGQPSLIAATGIFDELTVLVSDSGELGGETFEQAQSMMLVKAYPQPDGQVRLEVTPELHHGQPRQKFAFDESGGMARMDFERRKRSYNHLTTSAKLAPGSMLLFCCAPDRLGSLGQQFFTEKDGKTMQKLLVIRLSGTQRDDLFDPGETLNLPDK
jgi:hypothetical protein